MPGSVNKVILVGNLGRDPEVRTTQSDQKIVSLSVATSERWKDQSGQMQDRTEWHRVVIFNERLAEIAERYLRKGSSVYVEGQLQTRKWQDQSGQDRYSTEVVLSRFKGELTLLGGKGEGERDGGDQPRQQRSAPSGRGPAQRGGGKSNSEWSDDLSDDIPFGGVDFEENRHSVAARMGARASVV